jgi:hypothetical protein
MGNLQYLKVVQNDPKVFAVPSGQMMLHCTMSFIIGGDVALSTTFLCGAQK